jgi:hypothetical protein
VTGLVPNDGSFSGGESVVINGTGFTGATKVMFRTSAPNGGGQDSTWAFTVVSDTQITATTAADTGFNSLGCTAGVGLGGEDQGVVIVTTPAGSSPSGAGDTFTYHC